MSPLSRQWRTLEQLADSPSFVARAAEEFPGLNSSRATNPDRRRLLKLAAASLAMSSLGGCGAERELVPAVKAAPNIVPGLPNFYATAHLADGYAAGVVVKHFMGRPIKVEGNPHHPASLGATDTFAQAELLNFYDPDRSAAILERGIPSDRTRLRTSLNARRAMMTDNSGAGFRVLTGTVTSPTLTRQLDDLASRLPQSRWHQWEPISRDNVRDGSLAAYGQVVDAVPRLAAADVVLAIDSDLLSSAPGHLRFARDFASRRNPTRTQKMLRLYAIEPTPTLSGSVADHRFIAGPKQLQELIKALAAAVLTDMPAADTPDWLEKIVDDLRTNRGRALVHVGPNQPPEAHALVHAINEKLAAPGHTLDLIPTPVHLPTNQSNSLKELVDDMRSGRVDTLLIIDRNPVYDAPGSLEFGEALKRVDFTVALTPAANETSGAAVWSVSMAHPWEAWSDARAFDGTATILQPQALPLYDGHSAHEVLSLFLDPQPMSSLDSVRATWRSRFGKTFDSAWHDALASGVVADSASAPANVSLRDQVKSLRLPAAGDQALTILFRPDPHLWDGRYANNAWLQELPRPLTKLTWDNPLLIAPDLARQLGVTNGDLVRVSVGDATVRAPVWIMSGQASDCVVALLGFGRTQAGMIGNDVGRDFYPLVGREGNHSVEKAGGRVELASTEHHGLIIGRDDDVVRHGRLQQFEDDPHFLGGGADEVHLYRWKPEGPAAWAMSIDLNACIGCNACVIACQAENNIPVVGREEVIREREMHWLRIDRSYEGSPQAPSAYFQPMLCMHCEQAPCEVVCPVGATVHDAEGLNVMVYNRCIGTRFCSNNCPYKVRRFNYLDFAGAEHLPPQARNPEVTVRARGVMEKCTFCIQRIAQERIAADRANRPVGEVATACQMACPTRAFTFGNLADPDSEVAKRKQSPLDYALLADQNTHPRVTYEALIRNPNPSIEERGQ